MHSVKMVRIPFSSRQHKSNFLQKTEHFQAGERTEKAEGNCPSIVLPDDLETDLLKSFLISDLVRMIERE